VLVLAATPYQTFKVVPLVALEVVANVTGVLAGTAANLAELMAWLLAEDVGPAPNPPSPSTLYPQVLATMAIGEAWVPLLAGMLLPPEVKAVAELLVSLSSNKYPALSFVATLTASLLIVWAPAPEGVTFILTVPDVVIDITSEIWELIVVEPVFWMALAEDIAKRDVVSTTKNIILRFISRFKYIHPFPVAIIA
jgi:hypothetical protein